MGDRAEVSDALLALTTLLVGLGGVAGLILIARGRQDDVYPFAAAAAITGTVVGAARVLGGESARLL